MTQLFNELSVVGEKMSDKDHVVHLLFSLPESYNTLVTVLEASEKVPRWRLSSIDLCIKRRKQENGKRMSSIDLRIKNRNERTKRISVNQGEGALAVKHKYKP
uniref:Retrovirus-related Pol polyprotein from transposon TNT 1-94 n=1 Tax=Amphimedon queenslandica TaxID=400682 RepID=A0A1X7T1J3_AMPQE